MASNVLVQVGFLSEFELTPILLSEGALKRSLSSVDTQVVEEIVPLSEAHVAFFIITFENFKVSAGSWVLKFEDSELVS